MSFKPPQDAPKWDHNAEQILSLTKESIAKHRGQMDKIGSLAAKDCDFKSVRVDCLFLDCIR